MRWKLFDLDILTHQIDVSNFLETSYLTTILIDRNDVSYDVFRKFLQIFLNF